jgi:hypothetical protein
MHAWCIARFQTQANLLALFPWDTKLDYAFFDIPTNSKQNVTI